MSFVFQKTYTFVPDMKATTHRFNNPVWFKKWNRKAYSVFRSLGVVVHISRLSASVADQSLLKTSTAGMVTTFQSDADYSLASNWAEKQDEMPPIVLLLEKLLLAISTVYVSRVPATGLYFSFRLLNLKINIRKADSSFAIV